MKRVNPGRTPSRGSRTLAIAAVVCSIALGREASGQVSIDDYTRPILTRNGLSHYATIKDLAFTPDGKELLSAGFDKVIHVWDVANGAPRPIRTLRPPIFKGERGQIWSIALSPSEHEPGQRLLALAGVSVGNDAGTIVLMRYPGRGPANAGGSGELLGYLQKPKGKEARLENASARISKLAFTRDGRFLASADVAGVIDVWDVGPVGQAGFGIDQVSALKPVDINPPRPPRPAITSMVLAGPENGDPWIVTGHADGSVWKQPLRLSAPLTELKFARAPNEWTVCLGGGGALPWVVAGTSRGRVVKLDVDQKLAPVVFEPTPNESRRILAVDASADGRRIAVSARRVQLAASDPPPINGSDVILLETADGAAWTRRTIAPARFLVEAVRFGPGLLALGGDEDQAVKVLAGPNFDERAPNRRRLEAHGPGSVIWNVGFVNQRAGRVIAFSRDGRDYPKARPDAVLQGFDLVRRRPADGLRPDQVFRPDPATFGIGIVPTNGLRFDVTNGRVNRPIPIALDLSRDGPWYSHAFMPPVDRKPPLLAVGTEHGISVFNLDTGQRTRFLDGHEGTVTALGVSPDGKWLVSGSADQSLRLWAVQDFDRPIAFGASAAPAGANLVVSRVIEGSVAWQRGLRENDVIEKAYLDPNRTGALEPVPLDQIINRAEALEVDREIVLLGRKANGGELAFLAKKRQAPTLSLFVEKDGKREWVLWAPTGFYATSIEGDDRYIGWHQNKMLAGREKSDRFPDTEGTAFAPISTYKGIFQDNKQIDNLISSNAPALVPQKNWPGQLVVNPPPVIEYRGTEPKLEVWVAKDTPAPPTVDARANGRPVVLDFVKRGTAWVGSLSKEQLDSMGGAVRLVVETMVENQKSEPASRNVQLAPKPDRPGRLVVFGCGVETYTGRPKVAWAARDVEKLADFYQGKGYLVSPATGLPFPKESRLLIPPRVAGANPDVPAKGPTAGEFLKRLDELDRERLGEGPGGSSKLGDGDVVLMHLEADSLFQSSGDGYLLLGDWQPGAKTPGVDVREEVGKRLAAIVRTGCRVYLFLDIVHDGALDDSRDEAEKKASRDARDDWIRQLLGDGVSCFLASRDRPSWPTPREVDPRTQTNRLFARSILDVFRDAETVTWTLDDFAGAVRLKAERTEGRDLDRDFFGFWDSPLVNSDAPFITNRRTKK